MDPIKIHRSRLMKYTTILIAAGLLLSCKTFSLFKPTHPNRTASDSNGGVESDPGTPNSANCRTVSYPGRSWRQG